MTDLTVLALDKAFQLAEKNPQHWGVDAILKAAGEFHQFLTEGNLAEPLRDRLTEAEAAISALETRLDGYENQAQAQKKPSKPDKPVEF